jgi:hypothetical protein
MKVGDRVKRIKNGRIGTVIELDLQRGRARIQWDGRKPRTWIRFADLTTT